ncbi:uncharacterized protein B0T15DRAFT_310687 [Chaetomium strumarium]|uniref:Secreted protein n=1 Tax=Chaetomium strumarium TaxID=1170767 RepID=A0AAJ0GMC6_9PEZI|nr:hypothetical protein B0T15DRAFT_310687 [Chaetomium strumarium]
MVNRTVILLTLSCLEWRAVCSYLGTLSKETGDEDSKTMRSRRTQMPNPKMLRDLKCQPNFKLKRKMLNSYPHHIPIWNSPLRL